MYLCVDCLIYIQFIILNLDDLRSTSRKISGDCLSLLHNSLSFYQSEIKKFFGNILLIILRKKILK